MINPWMQLRWISEEKGLGLIATRLIPKGTITFAQDPLDIAIHVSSELLRDERIKPVIEKYSYLNQNDEFVISWDGGKYMNHCCYANTLTTGYGFEIAIRDIQPGEEVTDDYGVFTIRHNMVISCDKANCRGRVSIDDFERLLPEWDEKVISALKHLKQVEQPLIQFIDEDTLKQVDSFLETGSGYISVKEQKAKEDQFSFWTDQNA